MPDWQSVDAEHKLNYFVSLSLTSLIMSVMVPRAIVFNLNLIFHSGFSIEAKGVCGCKNRARAKQHQRSSPLSEITYVISLASVGLYWLYLLDKLEFWL